MDLVSEIGDFPSLQDFWEELESPTSNYTILLPPQEDLLLLENALFHLNLYRPAVFNSLLLHVVQGRYSLEDMTELAGYREGIPTMAPRCGSRDLLLLAICWSFVGCACCFSCCL